MGIVHLNGPPDCPQGQWCVACLMDAKQKQWEIQQEMLQAGWAASGDSVIYLPWPDALTKELRPGAYRAVSGEFAHLGVVDGLCWDHVAGTNPTKAPSTLATSAALPDGLRRPPGRGKR